MFDLSVVFKLGSWLHARQRVTYSIHDGLVDLRYASNISSAWPTVVDKNHIWRETLQLVCI